MDEIDISRDVLESMLDLEGDGSGFCATFQLFVPSFDRTFPVAVDLLLGQRTVADKTIRIVNEIANLTMQNRTRIRELLYADAIHAKETTAYGDPDAFAAQAKYGFFERVFRRAPQTQFVYIADDDPRHPCFFSNGIDSVEEKIEWLGFRINENDECKHRFALLDCRPPWEEEHGLTIVIRDGIPIKADDYQVSIENFDEK